MSIMTLTISIISFFILAKFIVPYIQIQFFTVANTPSIDIPNTPSFTGSILTTSEILDSPYIPPTNPFEKTEYSKVPRVVYGGTFKSAKLIIRGSILTPNNYFLILNFANNGGIIHAVRASMTQLDVGKTATLGGMFTQDSGINTSVNLMSDTLGTIQSEFQRTNLGSHIFNFLSTKQKSDVSPIIAIPFSNNGQYGGAVISSIQIQYSCQNQGSCLIKKCENSKLYSECIKEAFGVQEYNQWIKDHKN